MGYDKVYFFREGTFAVSYFIEPRTADSLGITCYLYNSPYSTLSSGDEVGLTLSRRDLEAAESREHTAPDGTLLHIVSVPEGESVYHSFAYAYLDNSFAAMDITADRELSTAEIDRIPSSRIAASTTASAIFSPRKTAFSR